METVPLLHLEGHLDELTSNHPRVYEKQCIFCLRFSRYDKGARIRGAPIPGTELLRDAKIREVSINYEMISDSLL